MDVLRLVTGDALGGSSPERPTDMALLAGDRNVQAHQREMRHAMIEIDLVPPARLDMAGPAIGAHGAPVDVIGRVAGLAITSQSCVTGVDFVAGIAFNLLVATAERKLGLAFMVELRALPAGLVMAACAVGAESAVMRVIGAMTSHAVLRDTFFHHAASMARITRHFCVRAHKSEVPYPLMIESRVLPRRGTVARLTVRTPAAPVNIIACVARITFEGRALE